MTRKGFVPRADRVDINKEFRSVEQFINEYVSNISHSGAFIRSHDPLPVGTKVNLRFTVILDEIETIEGVGQVVRVSDRPRGMGVVFVQLSETSKTLLARLLTRRPIVTSVSGKRPPPLPGTTQKRPPPAPVSLRERSKRR